MAAMAKVGCTWLTAILVVLASTTDPAAIGVVVLVGLLTLAAMLLYGVVSARLSGRRPSEDHDKET